MASRRSSSKSATPRRAVSLESGVQNPGIHDENQLRPSRDHTERAILNAQASPFEPRPIRGGPRLSSESDGNHMFFGSGCEETPSPSQHIVRYGNSSHDNRGSRQRRQITPTDWQMLGRLENVPVADLQESSRPSNHGSYRGKGSHRRCGHHGSHASYSSFFQRPGIPAEWQISESPRTARPGSSEGFQVSRPRSQGGMQVFERPSYHRSDTTLNQLNRQETFAHRFAQGDLNGSLQQNIYDPYLNSSSPLPSAPHQHAQVNPYTQESAVTSNNNSYFSNNTFSQPLQYHLYTSLGPHRGDLHPYQRAAYDFFIPDNLREDLQRKSAATLQILPNSTLPPSIEHFHTLVPLDTTNQKNGAIFGYPSWVYKAVSSKDGNPYALRRLEGLSIVQF